MRRTLVMALTLSAFLCSCSQRIAKLEQEVVELKDQQRKDRAELEKRIEQDNAALWAKVSCKNEKVRDFLQACKEGDGTECSPKAIDGAMAFLDTQPYVTLYLKPRQAATTMIALRRGQLVELIKTLYLYPTTRFLIIVQPRADDAEHQEEAQHIGDDVSQYLRFTLRLPGNRAVMGPYILPCKTKTNWIAHYGTRHDVPQAGEPPEKENRIRVWVFRTDC